MDVVNSLILQTCEYLLKGAELILKSFRDAGVLDKNGFTSKLRMYQIIAWLKAVK